MDDLECTFLDNRGLVYHILGRYTVPSNLREDAVQEGMLGLWEGVLDLGKYDPGRGALSTFLGVYISRRIRDFVWLASNRSGLSASPGVLRAAKSPDHSAHARLEAWADPLDAVIPGTDGLTVSDTIGADDDYTFLEDGLSSAVDQALGSLPDREAEVIRLHYGIGGDPLTYNEIADVLGITRSVVGHGLERGIRRLRSSRNRRLIADYFYL